MQCHQLLRSLSAVHVGTIPIACAGSGGHSAAHVLQGMAFTCSVLDASLRAICPQQKLSLWPLLGKVFLFAILLSEGGSQRG